MAKNSMVNTLTEKIGKMAQEFYNLCGDIKFLALIRKSDSTRWDVVISAEKLSRDDDKIVKKLEDMVLILKKHLNKDELSEISRFVLLESNDPFIREITDSIKSDKPIDIIDCRFGNINVEKAIILISK